MRFLTFFDKKIWKIASCVELLLLRKLVNGSEFKKITEHDEKKIFKKNFFAQKTQKMRFLTKN